MPKGMRNAMDQTKSVRQWVKAQKQKPLTTSGILLPEHHDDLEINISQEKDGLFILCITMMGNSYEGEYDDPFHLLEQIQEAMEEMFK